MLASWKTSLKLNILKDRIKLINHIKVPVHPALEEMGTEHTHLLHTEVRWLLKVDCWLDLLSYKGCSRDFFKKSSLAAHFSNTEWVTKFASLSDISNLLNKFNLSLQEKMTTVFKSADKVVSLKVKLELWG